MNHKPIDFLVRHTKILDVSAIISLSKKVYPKDVPYHASAINSQITNFPEGQFVALDPNQKIIGASASMLICAVDYELHTNWKTITSDGTITNHNQRNGDTLYGVDTMVQPSFQGMGVGEALHRRRVVLAKATKLKRIRGGARLANYSKSSKLFSPKQYLDLVISGEIFDPALTFLLRFGYVVKGLAENYLEHDPNSQGWAAIVEYDIHQ